jgi:tRNA(His) guanylyltransferase
MLTLRERINSYQELTDYKLLKNLPTIIILNGRLFKKITSLLYKPFSEKFMELMIGVVIKLCHEIDGVVFSYHFNDEIVLVLRNDQTANTMQWCEGKVQKTASIAAALATLWFNQLSKEYDIELFGDPIFIANTFVVPNLTEAINVLIYKQQAAHYYAVHNACFYELIKKYPIDNVNRILFDKSLQEKTEILSETCNIQLDNYPLPFRRGVAVYRAPKLIDIDGVEEIRSKVNINLDLPLFVKDHSFLGGIFASGRDVLRLKK